MTERMEAIIEAVIITAMAVSITAVALLPLYMMIWGG